MKRGAPMKRGSFLRSGMRKQPAPAEEARQLPETGNPVSPPRRGAYGPATLTARPREPKPIRSEEYRRLVAKLPCFNCGIQGHSQAAHPNSGKARGVKLSDLDCFPMCATRPGFKGCHAAFDQYEIVPKGQAMRDYEARAKESTQRLIRETT